MRAKSSLLEGSGRRDHPEAFENLSKGALRIFVKKFNAGRFVFQVWSTTNDDACTRGGQIPKFIYDVKQYVDPSSCEGKNTDSTRNLQVLP